MSQTPEADWTRLVSGRQTLGCPGPFHSTSITGRPSRASGLRPIGRQMELEGTFASVFVTYGPLLGLGLRNQTTHETLLS